MFKVENSKIHITRGDVGTLGIKIKQDDDSFYEFKKDDVIRLNVFKVKDHDDIKLTEEVVVSAPSEEIQMNLLSEKTRIGDIINKPVTYWYEIELNPNTNPQTIIGYDENGAKEFILYPESGDK